MKIFFKVAVPVLLILVLGYAALASHLYLKWRRDVDSTTASAQTCYVGHSRYDDWHKRSSIPYTSQTPVGIWAERFRAVHTSDSEVDVLKSLGEPDYVQANTSKDGTRFIGCSWMYNIKRVDDDVNYKTNSWIELFFNPNKKVDDKDAVNVADIQNRPFPRQAE